MTANSIKKVFAGFCFGLLIQQGVLFAQQAPPSDVPQPVTVGSEVGYHWYQKKADEWRSETRVLRTLQVLFVVVALVSSVLGASKIVLPRWWPHSLLPVTAALAIALFIGLDINTQANKQRQAWRHLSAALAQYRDGDAKIEVVRKAYVEAEEMIGPYNPQAPK